MSIPWHSLHRSNGKSDITHNGHEKVTDFVYCMIPGCQYYVLLSASDF